MRTNASTSCRHIRQSNMLTTSGRALAGTKLASLPLLTRLVDEVEVLKAALERVADSTMIKNRGDYVYGKPELLMELAAHQKRWEDLK
jgi:hypothetical protein